MCRQISRVRFRLLRRLKQAYTVEADAADWADWAAVWAADAIGAAADAVQAAGAAEQRYWADAIRVEFPLPLPVSDRGPQ